MDRVCDIREKLIQKYQRGDFVRLKDGTRTVELVGVNFIADEDTIFNNVNEAYVQREIEWYKSQSLNVYDIKGGLIPTIWKDVADKDGFINSNYGWCIYSNENCSQYRNCLKQLIDDPCTRRACMIYTRPNMQYEYHKNGMNDFMCTYSTQQFIRQEKLIYIVNMRSNDAIFGYRNDYAWHKHVALDLCKDLNNNNIKVDYEPTIIWNAGSFHVYQRHFKYIDEKLT